jgi:outer membrane protein assembly factor BamA
LLKIRKNKLHLSILAALTCGSITWTLSSHAAEPFLVKDIRIEGLQRVEPGTVFNYLKDEIKPSVLEGETSVIVPTVERGFLFVDL